MESPQQPTPLDPVEGTQSQQDHAAKIRASQTLVRLYVGSQGYFQGVVMNMSTTGVLVDFPGSNAPVLRDGETVELAISAERLTSSLRLASTVSGQSRDGKRMRYAFDIDTGSQMALRALVEGRRECRVAPSPGRPIFVLLRQEEYGLYLEATLEDVSKNGLSVMFPDPNVPSLVTNTPTKITLLLPDEKMPVRLEGYARNEQRQDGDRRLGIEFVGATPEMLSEDRIRYMVYVDSLKDDILRHLRLLDLTDEQAA